LIKWDCEGLVCFYRSDTLSVPN